MTPAELVETCERELAGFQAEEQATLEAQTKALEAFKAQPTDKNRKAAMTAKTDAEFATLAREGAEERLEQARKAKAQAEHDAAVAEVEALFQATDLAAYRAAVLADVVELARLREQTADLENKINATASRFRCEREHALGLAAELGLTRLRALEYCADGSTISTPFVTPAEKQQALLTRLSFKGDARQVASASAKAAPAPNTPS